MESLVVLLIFLAMFLSLPILVRIISNGKILAVIVSAETGLDFKLVKASAKYFLIRKRGEKADAYIVDSERRIPAEYPPFAPSIMRAPVNSLVYVKGHIEALDPKILTVIPKRATARIMGIAVSEKIVEDIASTVGSESEQRKKLSNFIFPIIIIGLILVVIFILMRGGF